MIASGQYLERINEKISILRHEIGQSALLGLQNIHKHCENLVRDLINLAWNYELINLNEKTQNFPGLDLGDSHRKVAFQVTGTDKKEKIEDTLEKCLTYEHYKTFSTICIFIITAKKEHYTFKTKTTPHFDFTNHHVFDWQDILRKISNVSFDPKKAIAELLDKELPAVVERLKSARRAVWHLPHQRNTFFTGRDKELNQIKEALEEASAISLTQALSGLGGIGKTQTAIEYAYRFREQYRHCFWIIADTETTLNSGYVEMSTLLGLPEVNERDISLTIESFKSWMAENEGWLLIFDNADDPSLLKRFLPHHPSGHILITSRARVLDAIGIATSIDIRELEEDEALKFLLQRTGRSIDDSPDHAYARELVRQLGYFPLAIEQAGAFILHHQTLFQDYIEYYKSHPLQLLNKVAPVSGDYTKTVNTTWALNFARLEQKHPESAIALTLSAFFSPDNIPLELLRTAYEMPEPGEPEPLHIVGDNPLALDVLLEPITRYSLIRRDIPSKTYTIHRLVQEVIREMMPEEQQAAFALKVTRAINNMFPDASYNTWQLCDQLLPHAMLAFTYVMKYGFTYLDAGNMLISVGAYLRIRARYKEAEQVHLQSVRIRQRDLGKYDAEVAEALNDLAVVYYDQYQFHKAEPLLIEASHILQHVLGDEHRDLALNCNNLGMVYLRMEKFEKARPYLNRALQVAEKTKKEDDPFYALVLNNVGELQIGLGNYVDAEKFARRSLEIREKINNPEKTMRSYNTVAWLQYKTGDMQQAERYFLKALSYAENVFGGEHPELILMLSRYADYLLSSNRNEEAGVIKQRVAQIKATHSILNDLY